MKPESPSEQLMYSTVKLNTASGSGTGYFFQFEFGKDKFTPIIVTNRHVINSNADEIVSFYLHLKDGENPADNSLSINYKTKWQFHSTQDLCFCFLAPLLHEIREKHKKEIFFIPLTEDLIWDNAKLSELTAIEDVVMVGYPSGLWDTKNNFPLFRKGITSSHPAIDFNKENIGAVDIASFPGSSGSPIFILDEKAYSNKKGELVIGGQRVVFLGTLFSGPQLDTEGKVVVIDVPTQQTISLLTPMMINLGYYIKANALLEFRDSIRKQIK